MKKCVYIYIYIVLHNNHVKYNIHIKGKIIIFLYYLNESNIFLYNYYN